MSTNPDILGMSDEDFLKLADPSDEVVTPAVPQDPPPADEPVVTPPTDKTQDNTQTGDDEDEIEEQPEPEDKGEPDDETPPADDPPADPPATADKKKKDGEVPPAGEPEGKKADGEAEPEPKPKTDDGKTDYEAFFKQVMAPFKANGKLIQLQSADEVISLMQMGANYTKKMQSIQPHKKLLMMLEQNGLLDENKLSFYIDLEKKNPEAIKKLLKDADIDPVDVDTSGEVKYQSGAHAISDQEVSFRAAIEEVTSMPGGKETIQSANTWDEASKKRLWSNPEILAVIHSHQANGIYAKITGEMDRRRILGQVGPNVSFLDAYKIIGDELAAKGVFQSGTQPVPSAQQPVAVRTPVAVRPAKTPVTKAADAQRVRAAAASRTVTRPAKAAVNVLAMSDEEFLKFEGKV